MKCRNRTRAVERGTALGETMTNITPSEASMLQQIAQRESGGSYTRTNNVSSASGAYQFINGTWAMATAATGIGTQYSTAAQAPPAVQDANALWLLRTYGPNATISWAASGPYDASILGDTSGGDGGGIVNPNLDLSSMLGDISGNEGLIALGIGLAVALLVADRG
jgi:hypothetical protein